VTNRKSASVKGKEGEEEVSAILVEKFGLHRNDFMPARGKPGIPDIQKSPKATAVFPFHVEVKREQRFSIYPAIVKAEKDRRRFNDRYYCVVARKNFMNWQVTIPFNLFLEIWTNKISEESIVAKQVDQKEAMKIVKGIFAKFDAVIETFVENLNEVNEETVEALSNLLKGKVKPSKSKIEEEEPATEEATESEEGEEEEAGEENSEEEADGEEGEYPFEDLAEFANGKRSQIMKWIDAMGIRDEIECGGSISVRKIQRSIAKHFGWEEEFDNELLRQEMVGFADEADAGCEQECMDSGCIYEADERDGMPCWEHLPDAWKAISEGEDE